jgi:hypothetical protein
MRHIVEASSRPDDTVLDTFGGGARPQLLAGHWAEYLWDVRWGMGSLREP